jgi:hypothetical protein
MFAAGFGLEFATAQGGLLLAAGPDSSCDVQIKEGS